MKRIPTKLRQFLFILMFARTGTYVFLFLFLYVFIYLFIFFPRATGSAVLQPCRTCNMLFVLLARCVVCVLGK